MNILLLGATGATGKHLLTGALGAGHRVTVLVRNPAKLTIVSPNLQIIVGDATDETALKAAMTGNEVIISALGAMSSSLITRAMSAVIDTAKDTGLERIIILSSFAAKRDQLTRTAKLLTGLLMRNIIADKLTGERALRNSKLDWTIVYAATLTNQASKKLVRVQPGSQKIGLRNTIARAGVAAWILAELDNKSYRNRDVTISE